MYDNQRSLRRLAQEALRREGYSTEIVGRSGARLRVTKDGVTAFTLVRTSSDRWLGWMRAADRWRGLEVAELIVAAVLNKQKNQAEVYALAPKDVREAFDRNLAARKAQNPTLSETAPNFVCMDQDERGGPASVGSNLKAKALWSYDLPLDAVGPPEESDAPKPAAAPNETKEGFAARVRQEFANLIGVSVEKVSVDFHVRL
jgi:hypothetical protein